jgi:ABC-type branched-subunit amino acid transport system ATPase component
MTVEENLRLGGWLLRRDPGALKQALDEACDRVPWLRHKRKLAAGGLSGGEQRMLEIARLTMTHPTTILLDEPSVGLMPRFVDELYRFIVSLREEGITLLVVEQNVRQVAKIADYLYVLNLGQTSDHGPRGEIERRLEEIVRRWI